MSDNNSNSSRSNNDPRNDDVENDGVVLKLIGNSGDKDGDIAGSRGSLNIRKRSYSDTYNPGAEGDDTALIHCKYERVHVKDFHAEVRGIRDVEFALSKAEVLLELRDNSLPNIIQSMLNSIENSQRVQKINVAEARECIFTSSSENLLAETIQGTMTSETMGGIDYDQAWICVMCDLPTATQRHIAFATLPAPVNLGPTCQDVRLVILVINPSKEKATKSTLETARTFSSLFSDISFRHRILSAQNKEEFRTLLQERVKELAREHEHPEFRRKMSRQISLTVFDDDGSKPKSKCPIGKAMWADIQRRLPHYFSDYKDGFVGPKTLQKVSAAIFFLYFACVLPNIAFGMLNSNNTHGAIGVKKILFSQMFGGIIFAVLGGQPLIVLLTTAPLALYTKIIYNVSEDFDLDFRAMYACVGLWNAGFLILYSLLGASRMMRWSSRSTEEIFSLFITFAFSVDGIRDCVKDFYTYYATDACREKIARLTSNATPNFYANYQIEACLQANKTSAKAPSPSAALATPTASVVAGVVSNISNVSNVGYNVVAGAASNISNTSAGTVEKAQECLRENSVLFLLLMLVTVWVGLTLFNFTKTPFLTAGKREILADYALPLSVLFVSFFGSFVFQDIQMAPFEYDPDEVMFEMSNLTSLPPAAVIAAAGLGFSLSLLFFMDQNISSALVNTPSHKLKKGAAYHWDLFVVALINGFLSVFSFPWIHAALPHSPLHVRALADMEERVEQGHVQQVVVNVRETRISGIISHILIGLSMFMLPVPLIYIPRPVLDGLFIYVAITALYGNQFFDRILLLITEQSAYPPNHYIRRVPQRKVHTFTGIQTIQLLVLCIFGFSPVVYMKMIFPVLLMFLMPIRHKLVPRIIEPKYLKALDGC